MNVARAMRLAFVDDKRRQQEELLRWVNHRNLAYIWWGWKL